MNDPINLPIPKSSSLQEASGQGANNSQVLLPRLLIQRIKDDLRQLKQDTNADYSLNGFLVRVIEKHWIVEIEQLRKGLEKLKWNK